MSRLFCFKLKVPLEHVVVHIRRVCVEVNRASVHQHRVAVVELCNSADHVSEAIPACPDAVDEQGADELRRFKVDGLHADVALGRGCHSDGGLSGWWCG